MHRSSTRSRLTVLFALLALLWTSRMSQAQAASADPAAVQQIMKADAGFAAAVASRNREQFLSFVAETTTFNGGAPGEVHGRDAVMKDWADFFNPDGPTLAWAPTHGEVIGAGDLGYTVGNATFTGKNAAGVTVERHSTYLTVWRKQRDGRWMVVFDTGSTLPAK